MIPADMSDDELYRLAWSVTLESALNADMEDMDAQEFADRWVDTTINAWRERGIPTQYLRLRRALP